MPPHPRVLPAYEPPMTARHGGDAAHLAHSSLFSRCPSLPAAEARPPARLVVLDRLLAH